MSKTYPKTMYAFKSDPSPDCDGAAYTQASEDPGELMNSAETEKVVAVYKFVELATARRPLASVDVLPEEDQVDCSA